MKERRGNKYFPFSLMILKGVIFGAICILEEGDRLEVSEWHNL